LVEVHDLSFPSGHAMLSAVTYLTLGALLARSDISRQSCFRNRRLCFSDTDDRREPNLSRHPLSTWRLVRWREWALACWLVARSFIPVAKSEI
jgi:undecaprenyl-diphosphatase